MNKSSSLSLTILGHGAFSPLPSDVPVETSTLRENIERDIANIGTQRYTLLAFTNLCLFTTQRLLSSLSPGHILWSLFFASANLSSLFYLSLSILACVSHLYLLPHLHHHHSGKLIRFYISLQRDIAINNRRSICVSSLKNVLEQFYSSSSSFCWRGFLLE